MYFKSMQMTLVTKMIERVLSLEQMGGQLM